MTTSDKGITILKLFEGFSVVSRLIVGQENNKSPRQPRKGEAMSCTWDKTKGFPPCVENETIGRLEARCQELEAELEKERARADRLQRHIELEPCRCRHDDGYHCEKCEVLYGKI